MLVARAGRESKGEAAARADGTIAPFPAPNEERDASATPTTPSSFTRSPRPARIMPGSSVRAAISTPTSTELMATSRAEAASADGDGSPAIASETVPADDVVRAGGATFPVEKNELIRSRAVANTPPDLSGATTWKSRDGSIPNALFSRNELLAAMTSPSELTMA